MRELAAILRKRPNLRIRQGVVTAVDTSTCSVLIGGSEVAVEGVQHLNSAAPAVDDVVWIASDGADLWIMGTHGARSIDGAEILTGTISAARLEGIDIVGVTITGDTIRTAEDGLRVEITGGANDRITWYDGYDASGWASVVGEASSSALNLVGPERRSSGITTGCQIQLICSSGASGIPQVKIEANDALLTVGTSSGAVVRIDGDLNVYGGRINPGTNWGSGTSNDGVWIQEGSASAGYTGGRRWKLYYDTVNHRLFVRAGSSAWAYFTPDAKAY